MNTKTKEDLIALCDAVEKLAHGTLLTIGMETASEVCQACENLKDSLEKDETITEVR